MAIDQAPRVPTVATALPRRLLVACPETGLLTATGLDLWNPPTQVRNTLVDCLECGQDHEWQLEEAIWDPVQVTTHQL